jgi:hypothetical protein
MTPGSSLDFSSVEEIQKIAAMTDAALRNLRITYTYYRLNRAMSALAGARNLTWCGYAIWASKTAGEYIRQQEVPALIEDWIKGATDRAGVTATLMAHALGIHSDQPVAGADPKAFTIRGFAAEVLGGVGAAIGNGNQIVFAHIAPPFATLLSLWTAHQGAIPDAEKQRFLQSLRDPNPPADALYQAFSAMFDATEAPGSLQAAQSMCYANALIGCVEQTRVQPYIAQSLNVPVADLFLQHVDDHLRGKFPTLVAAGMKDVLRPLAHELETGFQRLSTEWVMRLNLPDESLRLGLNVPPLPDGAMYPEELAALAAAQPLEAYTSLSALDAAESAAQDWVSYPQRMRYIAVVFRSRQQVGTLWNAPYTEAQVEQFTAGQIPPGLCKSRSH